MTTVFICRECPGAEERLRAARHALAGASCEVRDSACLGGCRSGASVAIRAPGKMAYLFGPVAGGDLDGLPALIALYAAAPDGVIHDARPLGSLRLRLLARIPAIS